MPLYTFPCLGQTPTTRRIQPKPMGLELGNRDIQDQMYNDIQMDQMYNDRGWVTDD